MKFITFLFLFYYFSSAYAIDSNEFVLLKPFSIGPLVGVSSVSNGGGTNIYYGLAAGYKITNSFGVGLEYQGGQFSRTAAIKSNISLILANAVWFFEQDDSPYVGIKVGTSNWTAGSTTLGAGTSIAAGPVIGTNIFNWGRSSFGAELSNIWLFSGVRISNLQLLTNFKFWF